MRRIIFILLTLAPFYIVGCSWTVHFYVVNDSTVPRSLEIQLSPERDTFLIFDPRHFAFLPWESDAPDYERIRRIPQGWREKLTIEIPSHTALDIGHLNNEKYDSQQQRFINGRFFNLLSLKTDQHRITRDTFDQHFHKTDKGMVWIIPR